METQEVNPSALGFVKDRQGDGKFNDDNRIGVVTGGASAGGKATAKKADWRRLFNAVARKIVTEKAMERLVQKTLDDALEGNDAARRELLNRLLGKADLNIDANLKVEGKPIDQEAIDAVRRMAMGYVARLPSGN